MKGRVAEACFDDCRKLADAMDEQGREFIRRGWGVEPCEGLQQAFKTSSMCRTIICTDDNGHETVAGMFGCNCVERCKDNCVEHSCVEQDKDNCAGHSCAKDSCVVTGNVWLTTAPVIERVKLQFIRQSRGYIKEMLRLYERLECYVHKGNAPLIGWLKWCGFDLREYSREFLIGEMRR